LSRGHAVRGKHQRQQENMSHSRVRYGCGTLSTILTTVRDTES
jgi:hypothetical protein